MAFDSEDRFSYVTNRITMLSILGCAGILINGVLIVVCLSANDGWFGFFLINFVILCVAVFLCHILQNGIESIRDLSFDLFVEGERNRNEFRKKELALYERVVSNKKECLSKKKELEKEIADYKNLKMNNRNLEDVLKGKIENIQKEHSDEMARLEHEYETKKKELEENAAMFKLNCYYEHEALRAELEESYQAKHNELKELLRNEHPFCKVAELYNDAYLLLFGDKKPNKIDVYHYKLMEYRIKVLRQVFPEIEEYIVGEDTMAIISEYLNDERTKPKYWLSDEEYSRVQNDEDAMEQLALDRYFQSSKRTKWEIGRDYEMFYGHNLYNKGYEVIYNGIEKGMLDNGIDLIARKGNVVWIIQCKNWGPKGTIYTKTVMQVYGAKEWYRREHANEDIEVKAEIVTSSFLTDEAKIIAKILGVAKKEHLEIQIFPAIKCNVNSRSEKIYHLPFDRDYDRTKIIHRDQGECYALTIKQARDMGFRRAYITNN